MSADPFTGSGSTRRLGARFPREATPLPEDLRKALPPFDPRQASSIAVVTRWEPGKRLHFRAGEGETKARVVLVLLPLLLAALVGAWVRGVAVTWSSGTALDRVALGASAVLSVLFATCVCAKALPMAPGTRVRVTPEEGFWSAAGGTAASAIPPERLECFYVDLQTHGTRGRLRL